MSTWNTAYTGHISCMRTIQMVNGIWTENHKNTTEKPNVLSNCIPHKGQHRHSHRHTSVKESLGVMWSS